MYDEHTTNRMIDSFLSRKAKEHPDIFGGTQSESRPVPRVRPFLVDIFTQ